MCGQSGLYPALTFSVLRSFMSPFSRPLFLCTLCFMSASTTPSKTGSFMHWYRSSRTLFPPPSSSGASALPSALEPDGGPKDSVRLPPSKEVKPQMKVGDYVCVHNRNMGRCHLPSRIIGEFGGHYHQLYCSKGVLNTSFCGTELIPLAIAVLLLHWKTGGYPPRSHYVVL